MVIHNYCFHHDFMVLLLQRRWMLETRPQKIHYRNMSPITKQLLLCITWAITPMLYFLCVEILRQCVVWHTFWTVSASLTLVAWRSGAVLPGFTKVSSHAWSRWLRQSRSLTERAFQTICALVCDNNKYRSEEQQLSANGEIQQNAWDQCSGLSSRVSQYLTLRLLVWLGGSLTITVA